MMDSPLRVVIATTAFGLGIDCPDVRHVINLVYRVTSNPMFRRRDEQVETAFLLLLL